MLRRGGFQTMREPVLGSGRRTHRAAGPAMGALKGPLAPIPCGVMSLRHRAARLSAHIDVLNDHGLTALVADPLESLDQRGEGPRQSVGVVEVHAPKRLG